MVRFLNGVIGEFIKSHRIYKAYHFHTGLMADQQESVQYNTRSDPDAIKYQLETDKLASELKKKMGLKPVKKTNDAGEEFIDWVETERAWANKKGINNIVGIVRGYSDKINQLSNYIDRQIRTLMREVHRAIARDIAENWTEYDIGKRGNADNIVELTTNIVWSTFNAAKEGRAREIAGESAETKTVTKTDSSENSSRIPFLGD